MQPISGRCASRPAPKSQESSPTPGLPNRTVALYIILSTSDLSRLYRTHLLRPALRRLELLHSPDFVGSISRHANVVVAFQNELDVADLERGGVTELGKTTSARNDLIDEVIRYLKDGLEEQCQQNAV